MRLTPPITVRLDDADAEKIRRNHEQRIGELQALPGAAMRVARGIVMPNSTPVTISHGLGRAPLWVGVSAPRSATAAGFIADAGTIDSSGNPIDRDTVVVLTAAGYGATITVDVVFL